MEDVLEQTAAAILGLDPDYSTQQEIEAARTAALAALPPEGDDVAAQMVERAAALLLGAWEVTRWWMTPSQSTSRCR